MAGFKLGIVRLGQAAGKIKYALLDERDISLVQDYAFEARTEIDQDGTGAKVYAYAYRMHSGRHTGQHLHEIIWERHSGGIAPGWKVIHKNNITVDNRLENLCLVPEHFKQVSCPETELSSKYSKDQSLYWIAVQQLHNIDPLHHHIQESIFTRLLDRDGDPVCEEVAISESGCVLFYECHYPPCTNMEKHIREFSICGRCQTVRYCGVGCQQKDWPVHKQLCRERIKPEIMEYPDR
ncbi:zinc finger MYND domain-containing protein 19-like [Mercenaria mercenaria]|uniref:zinc finger MYND domain-containing protein 19-like n=1 Tax=Mercenaria mercenaria TaxID=6596 RepID=UPI001E1DCF48|nr:zinc finger MYND domain-containing protein 19-like [Mercenaria mercenaria]